MDCQNILNDKGCFLASLCIKKDQVFFLVDFKDTSHVRMLYLE
jgi:hypothetical protein